MSDHEPLLSADELDDLGNVVRLPSLRLSSGDKGCSRVKRRHGDRSRFGPVRPMSGLRSIALSVIFSGLAGCATHAVQTAAAESLLSGTRDDGDLTPINAAADPCTSFVTFACGVRRAPPGRLEHEAQVWSDPDSIVRQYLDSSATPGSEPVRPSAAMVREFYALCTDSAARSGGLAEVRTHAEGFNRARTLPEFARELGSARISGDKLLVSLEPHWDAIQENGPTVARIHLEPPELNRSAYADTGRPQALREHWLRLAKLAGFVSPADVEAALRVDRWLADSPDPDAGDPWSAPRPLLRASELRGRTFPWDHYLAGGGLARESPLRPAASDSIERIDGLTRFPLHVLRSYVRVMLVERASEFLSWPFVEEELRFHDGVLRDRSPDPLAPADYCFNYTFRALDTWLAQAYLPTIVSPAGERAARRMFPALRRIFEQLVTRASWMDEASRGRALAKVSATELVFIADLEQLNAIVPHTQGSLLTVLRQIMAAQTGTLFRQIGRPSTGPPLLATWDQALYANFSNQIWISPVIARPPFLRIPDPDPITYGAFGVILGHEIAHTLSVTGKRYDGAGILRTWWSSAAVAGFDERAECLSQQLEAFVGRPSDKYPLDEFVADLGGVQIAVRALDDSLVAPTPEVILERRRTFFTAYAQQTCGWFGEVDKLPREAVARVNGVLADVPEFAEAFRCRPGSSMAPARRCSIW